MLDRRGCYRGFPERCPRRRRHARRRFGCFRCQRALARAVHRPAIIPLPTFALRAVLGEFANETVASQRVLPTALNRAGFTFADADLDSALQSALRRD